MLQSGQVLCDQYRLVERLGRSPGRQTWRALNLKSDLSPMAPGNQPSAEVAEEDLRLSDPWDSGEMAAAIADPDLAGLAGQGANGGDALSEQSLGPDGASGDGEPDDGETVILKLLAFSDEIDWGQVKLFEREAAVLKGLNHPALPRYRDSFSLEDRLLWFCLVQDDIPGQSLDQLLAEGGTCLTEAQLRQWAGELLEILIYLHGQSPPILHRDIKPSNVIWGDDQQIYLIDLGAVQDYVAKASLGSSFTVVGTYGYAPLEQFGGRAVPASDLYALGATLVHLLTGIAPADLPQENLRLQFEAKISPEISPAISLSFRRWLQHLLEPDVQRRTPSARAALLALRQLPELSSSAAVPTSSEPQRWTDLVDTATLFPRQGQLQQSEVAQQQMRPSRWPAVRPDMEPGWVEQRSPLSRSPQPPAQPQPSPIAPSSQTVPPGPAQTRLQPGSSSLELLAAPTPAPLAPVGARLRLKRSPDLLLVEMPGEELGYVFAVLGVGFSIWALLTSSVTLPFCLLFTLLGIFLATPQVLRFERRGSDIRFSLGKQLGGYLLRWGRRQASGSLRQVFHTVESSRPGRQSDDSSGRLLRDRFRDDRQLPGSQVEFGQRLNQDGFGGLESNRRTLVVQTQQRDIPISTSLSWQEGTWLVDQIYAWCDGY